MSSRSFEAKDMYKQNKFDEIISIYQNVGAEYHFNEWDYFYYANALRKKGLYTEAIKLSQDCLNRYPNFEFIINCHCWNLYYNFIKDFSGEKNEQQFIKAVNKIISLCEQGKYSPYKQAIFKVVDYYKAKQNVLYDRIDYYLSKLNVELLEETSNKATVNNREIDIASEREKWYSNKCKALFNLKKYNECIEISQLALATLKEFHHDNDIWFKYRIACSYLKTGELIKAKEIAEDILKYKEHWVIYATLFLIYKEENNFDFALKNGSKAALSMGEHKHKMELYNEMALLLKDNNMPKESYYHLLLIKKIREQNQWKVKDQLVSRIEEYNENDIEMRSLMDILQKFWRQNKLKGEKKYLGVISNILPNGKAGFIKDYEDKSYYFRLSGIVNRKTKLEKGVKVSFYIKDSFDKRKNQTSTEAIEITIERV